MPLSGDAQARPISAQLPRKNRLGAGAAVDVRSSRNQGRASVSQAGSVTNPFAAAPPIGGPGAEARPISRPDWLDDQSLRHAAEPLIHFDPILPANAFIP